MEIKDLEREFIEQKIKDSFLLIGKDNHYIHVRLLSRLRFVMDTLRSMLPSEISITGNFNLPSGDLA